MMNEMNVNDHLLKTHANEPYTAPEKHVTEPQNTIVVHVKKENIFQKLLKRLKSGKK